MEVAAAAAQPAAGEGATAAGCDLVHVPGFKDRLHPRFLARAFADEEVKESLQRFDAGESLAARWAAKEAAFKAFRQLARAFAAPVRGLGIFRDYVVATEAASRVPLLRLSGRPAALLEQLRAKGASVSLGLSLTHDGDYAAAFVVVNVRMARP